MGLIAHYPLQTDGSNRLGQTAELTGGLMEVDGRTGLFTKGNRLVASDPSIARAVRSGNFSVNFWIYMGVNGESHPWRAILSLHDTPSSGKKWRIERGADNYYNQSGWEYALSAEYSGGIGHTGSREFFRQRWNLVTYTYSGDTRQFWVNGELLTQSSSSNDFVHSTNETELFIVGAQDTDDIVSDIRLYDHVLSVREIRDLNLGLVSHFPLLKDEWGSHGTSSPVVVNATPSEDGGFEFTGSDSYIDLGEDKNFVGKPDNSPLTVCAWIKPSTFSTRDMILSKNPNRLSYNFSYMFGLINGNMNAFTGSAWRSFLTDGLISIGKWSHVAWVFDGTTLKGYVNGELIGSRSDFTYTNKEPSTVKIGGHYPAADFHGAVRDHRVYSNPLTGEQIKELAHQRASIDRGGSVNVGQVVEHLEGGGGLPVVVNSSGKDDGDQSWIYVDSINYSYRGRGHNIVVLAPNGKVVSQANFDTHSWLRYRIDAASSTVTETRQETEDVMLAYLEAIPEGHYVAFAVHDQGRHSRSSVHAALAGLGFRRHVIGFRDGWAALCRKGSWAIEDVSARFSGYVAEVRQSVVASPAAHDQGFRAPDLSEVGPARGLVAWYPLVSDTLDYAGVNHAVNNGAVLTAEGYAFESSTYLHAAAPVLPSSGDGVEATMSAWIKPGNFSGEGWIVSQYASGGALRFIWNTTSSGRMRYFIGGSSITGTAALATNTWVHVCVTRKADGAIDLFLNGQPDGSGTLTDLYADTPLTIGNSAGDSGASLAIRDVRIHNVALSPEEVALLYNMTRPDGSKTAFTENCMYTRGQIKEVIA